MTAWKEYKKTYRAEADIFDFARVGDLRGLANMLSQHGELDVDAKNNRGYSALMLAVYNSENDFCETLLRCGANVDSTDAVGNTVLMAAAYKGNLDILKLLLEYGASLTLKNKTNMDVRDWASMFGRKEILQYLDSVYPSNTAPSQLTNIARFLKLGFCLLFSKLK
ncbi:ankyrin repeat domain-containing protein [Shewanella saliphila]|uniref:Protein fem-1 homolog B n=1 Tax=Shewanella saliphila TaxID=2282698 RepID=A0ABQ2QCT2_9GAMM|nr:ankyrin repeat domain-containing protein [Shewanella saliphila]MCL1103316.1 ankyrin repeat domain-containing protein [Shewanella saliphila]GGP68400.1 hypothetical protein GCM10009409_36670 [Shewanella saliphila]